MQANGSEFEANGFHGAVEAALLQCTMELDSAYVQGDMVRGREQGHLQRRVRPPWLRGSGVSEKYDLSVRNHPLVLYFGGTSRCTCMLSSRQDAPGHAEHGQFKHS